jgi:hypothetical protein
MRRRVAYAILAAVVTLLVVAQVALPPLAADRVADRLTQGGGTASASVSALPALRLFFGDGDRLTATGSGLDLEPASSDTRAFDRLDGFDEVSVQVTRSRVGPLRVGHLALTRSGLAPYRLVARASTTGHELLGFGADRLGFLGGLALRFGGGQVLGAEAAQRIPIRLDMQLGSDDGRVVVVGGSGTIDGVPTGPLGELITAALAIRL